MTKGISLHLGLNYVDATAYGNWSGALSGCVNDANSMKNIAASCGYTTNLLLNEQATSQNLIAKLTEISGQLVSGDYFMLTFSCHGGQFTTTVSADEPDGKDETLVLYNRQFVDNELNNLLAKFSSGVKIFVTSDSCHSGTVVRRMPSGIPPTGIIKAMPEIIGNADYLNRKAEYDSIISASRTKAMINAEIIYISGCQDDQVSYDGNVNGAYTTNLLQVWNNAAFNGGYVDFYNQIKIAMGASQVPNLMQLGIVSNSFLNSKPFIIMPNTTTTPTPTVSPTDITSSLDVLTESVGDAGANKSEDAIYIQGLLNDISKIDGGTAENLLGVDGGVGSLTKNAIKKFQQTHNFLPSRLVKPNSILLLAMLYKAGRI